MLDGYHRYISTFPEEPFTKAVFPGTYEEAVNLSIRANGTRRHLKEADRAMSIVSCTGWSTLPGPMATEGAQQTYGDPRGPWMSRDEQAQAVGVAVKTITRARGIWLIDHGLLVAECSGCHERPPAPGEKLCSQCLEEKANQPTKIEVLEARIAELRQEIEAMRGQLELLRPVDGEEVDEALRLTAAESQEQAATLQGQLNWWRQEAKNVEGAGRGFPKALEATQVESEARRQLVMRLNTLLEFERWRQPAP